jgi:hypothetical protein
MRHQRFVAHPPRVHSGPPLAAVRECADSSITDELSERSKGWPHRDRVRRDRSGVDREFHQSSGLPPSASAPTSGCSYQASAQQRRATPCDAASVERSHFRWRSVANSRGSSDTPAPTRKIVLRAATVSASRGCCIDRALRAASLHPPDARWLATWRERHRQCSAIGLVGVLALAGAHCCLDASRSMANLSLQVSCRGCEAARSRRLCGPRRSRSAKFEIDLLAAGVGAQARYPGPRAGQAHAAGRRPGRGGGLRRVSLAAQLIQPPSLSESAQRIFRDIGRCGIARHHRERCGALARRQIAAQQPDDPEDLSELRKARHQYYLALLLEEASIGCTDGLAGQNTCHYAARSSSRAAVS